MPASNASNLPALAELSDLQIAAAARAAGEPDWLVSWRERAWHSFAESVPPFWRRTDLTKFKSEGIVAPLGAGRTQLLWDAAPAAQGVVFTTLAEAVQRHPELVRQHLGTAVDPLAHKFTALHAALWQDGVFLYVPRNVAVELPLLASFSLGAGEHAIFPHNLIILERGASVTFIEEYSSDDQAGQALSSPATELIVGEGAALRYITAQSWGRGVYHIGATRARIANDGSVEWVMSTLGGQLQHMELETSLEGNGSRVEWIGATFADGDQTLLSAPILRHIGASTESHLDFKTVVDDLGYSVFDGLIKIEHASRATSTRLEEHALHLSPKSRTDSIPGLKIDTNDVARAGHASTSGEVDEEQLFYMLSRGIQRDDAIRMIVMGFFEPVLERLPLESLRERLTEQVEQKIGR